MKAREVLRRSPVCCTPLSSLDEVGRRMYESDQGSIPVADPGGRIVGLLTDREIAMALAARNRGADQILARELLGGELVTCSAEDEVPEVLGTMERRRLRGIPVLEADGRILGVITLEDIARASIQGSIPPQLIVRVLQALGKTRVEAGEEAPRWPWVSAGSR